MTALNHMLNLLFDLVMRPLSHLGQWPAMVVLSLVSTVLLLLVFKYTSNQKALRRRKNAATARLLEFVLFTSDPVVNLGAFPRAMAANLAYLGHLLVPLLITSVPVALLLIQMACWFEYRPLSVGTTTVLTVRLPPDSDPLQQVITLTPSPPLTVEAGPVRVPSLHEVSWRLRVQQGGPAWVDLAIAGRTVRKAVVAGPGLQRVSSLRPGSRFWKQLLNPSEPPLPTGSAIRSIEVLHPAATFRIGFDRVHWLVVFLILTLGFGLILLKPLRMTM
jgi:hypothetical protein